MHSINAFPALLLFISSIESIATLATMPVRPAYSNYVVSKQAVTWKEAFVLCKQNGMDLVSIKNAEEHDAVAEALAPYPTIEGVNKGYWTAAMRFGTNSFVWFTDGQPMVYTNFEDGQPDNFKGMEECVEYVKTKNKYRWNDIPCGYKFGYICQMRNVLC
ncbi:lectin subunit alpha [Dendroctonus ponderosae]|uniref:C-type lectin domain-containing protein n=1 Tax=Dendroctonus ponderosae TaxID=77166 RepID=U4UUA4_DENPD|nr:lectin subunit alpha [Dendroctonus ponderosae]ERL96123.1 hypothetical protein D910_01109 [Dendroctonus ponderosae]